MVTLDFKAFKAGFFDRKVVTDATDRATRAALSKAGALVRRRAQASLVYDRADPHRVSAPGQPPVAHKSTTVRRTSRSTGRVRYRAVSPLREFLFFAYDRPTGTTVVGPARLGGTVDPGSLAALEYGGESKSLNVFYRHGRRRTEVRPVHVAARPFMRPALAAEAPGLPALWRNSVR